MVPLKLSSNGYSIVITNSGVRRGLVDSEYNARRLECSQGVTALSQLMGRALNSLRDVTVADIEKHGSNLDEKARRRSKHVVSENQRVSDAVEALASGDIKAFGQFMNESHQSLKDDFEVSCTELDALVELSQKHPGVAGARMTGAGFGGCTVAIVASDAVESFKSEVIPAYERQTGLTAQVYVCAATDGASTVAATAAT